MSDPLRAILASGTLRWLEWSAACTSERPRLVFAGACLDHWSAVLAAELVADVEAQALIATVFTPVIIDPLSDPEPCARMQEVLALTSDAAGLPAVALVLPDGGWVGAVPWRPLRDRDRQRGLLAIVLELATAWQERPEDLRADAMRVRSVLSAAQAALGSGRTLQPTLVLDAGEAALVALADPLHGGFGQPPRGLGSAALAFLARRAARPDAPLVVAQTLERALLALIQGAAHDQLGGAFTRGVSDAAWRRPFCEIRLVDQGAVASVLFAGARALGREAYAVAGNRTLRWTIDHLRRPDGWYQTGWHADAADAAGRPCEGAHLTWTPDELTALLGSDTAQLVAERFGLHDAPEIAGRYALAVRQSVADEAATLAAALQRLAVARAERPRPLADERRDLRAHGDLLAALARSDWREAGSELAALLTALPPTGSADARASVARGLACWGASDVARAWANAAAPLCTLDPPPLSGVDDERGASAAALLADAWCELGECATAHAILTAHASLIRRAPATAAGLLSVCDRLSAGA